MLDDKPSDAEPRLIFGAGGLVMSDTPSGEQDKSHVALLTLEAARLRLLAAQGGEGQADQPLLPAADALEAHAFVPVTFRNPGATAGGELPLSLGPDEPGGNCDRAMVATVRDPDLVRASADVNRLRNAQDTGSLEFALDVATELRAKSNLERMLIQAMAACYNGANKLQAAAAHHVACGGGNDVYQSRMADLHDRYGGKTRYFEAMRDHNAEAARLSNAAARQWASFYLGVQTLAQLRRGGKQKITVQHVHVSDGGQAVVAQTVKGAPGRSRRGRGAGNQKARQTP